MSCLAEVCCWSAYQIYADKVMISETNWIYGFISCDWVWSWDVVRCKTCNWASLTLLLGTLTHLYCLDWGFLTLHASNRPRCVIDSVQALRWLRVGLFTRPVHSEVWSAVKISANDQLVLVIVNQLVFPQGKKKKFFLDLDLRHQDSHKKG